MSEAGWTLPDCGHLECADGGQCPAEPEVDALAVAITASEVELVNDVLEQQITLEMTQDHRHVLILEFPNVPDAAEGRQIDLEALGSLLSLAAQTWPSIIEQMEAQLP